MPIYNNRNEIGITTCFPLAAHSASGHRNVCGSLQSRWRAFESPWRRHFYRLPIADSDFRGLFSFFDTQRPKPTLYRLTAMPTSLYYDFAIYRAASKDASICL